MERKIRREVRVLDVPFWGRTTSMFFQVYMNREPKSDSDLFKIMMRFRKKSEKETNDEVILKFNFNELITIYTYLSGGDVPEEFIDKKDGSLKLVHPDRETNKTRKVIKFKIDEGIEDPTKRGTLLITVADYTRVLKGEAKKPLVIYKRLIISEVEIFKKLLGNLVETLISATINYHMFNKYFKWKIRDLIKGESPQVDENTSPEEDEEALELAFDEEI